MEIKNLIINKELTIREGLKLLEKSGKKLLFVVDDKGSLVGVISDGDVRRWILSRTSIDEPVSAAMNKNPTSINVDDEKLAKKIMREAALSAIPVIGKYGEIVKIYFSDGEAARNREELKAKVVIMAGGAGKRLLPYTSVVPKPLIPIGEKPIIELVMDSFANYGCKDFILSLYHKKSMIKAYFEEEKLEWEKGYSISYIEEPIPLGTGGSLCFLKDAIEAPFFVSNCDILLKADYADIYKFHKERGNMITMVTSIKNYVVPYGIVNLDSSGQIESLVEKPSADYLVNTGIYVINPEILDLLGGDGREFLHITQLIERCIAAGKPVGTYPVSEDSWLDMGQFDELEKMKNSLEV